MTSRERVRKAYSHEEGDRVPVCIGGTAQKFSKKIYYQVKDALGVTEGLEEEKILDELGNIIHYHPEVLNHLGCDFRHIQINRPDPIEKIDEKTRVHELGIILQEGANGIVSIVSHPFKGKTGDEIANIPWPETKNPERVKGLRETARKYREETDYAVGLYKATFLGVFDLCCALRGMDQFMMDMMLDEKLALIQIEKAFRYNYDIYELALDEVAEYVDVIEFNDDLGTQENLLIPPDIYRRLIKPYHQRMTTLFKEKAPHAKVLLHSCGAVSAIIEDFITIGVDILNPVQPTAKGMDTYELKAKYGSRICFQGGIDLQEAMVGNVELVEEEVKKRIDSLAPGGGYVLSSANNIGDDVPIENVFKLYEYTRKYGKYPITLAVE